MSLRDCLTSAAEQGAITRQEATALLDEFDQRFAQNRASLGDDVAAAKARTDLETALRAQAAEKRRRAQLTDAARKRIKGRLLEHRTAGGERNIFQAAMGILSHYGYRGSSSVRGRTEAITSMAHGKLADLMGDVRRTAIAGRRTNKALIVDIVRELRGEASGNADAAAHARAIATVFEDLRQRFNNAGGAIPKLDGWGLPQSHDAAKIRKLGRDAWKARIAPLLDPDKMVDPLTGDPLGAAGLDRALDHVFASIVSDGWANRKPSMAPIGRGAIASQRQDARFLVFKDADAWMEYNRTLGAGDPVQSMFTHINDMARDIAAMEELGPNPQAMVEYIKQVVGHEIGKDQAGLPNAAGKQLLGASAARAAQFRIDSLWGYIRGRPEVVSGWAQTAGDIKNVMTSALLGSASVLAALSDPFIAQASRRLAGLPVMTDVRRTLKELVKADRREVARAGVIWEEYVHLMNDDARIAGIVTGSDWSRYLVDRSVTFSLLKPLTQGRKHVEARNLQAALADQAGQRFDQLDRRLRDAMGGFGIDAADWDVIRRSVDDLGFITPMAIESGGGTVRYLDERTADPVDWQGEQVALRHRRIAEKLAEFQSSWSERAVPSGTPNARSIITGTAERGTFAGEFVDFMLQFKSFGLSFTSLQLEAMGRLWQLDGRMDGAKYLALLAIPLTVAGAMHMQLKSVADGKDPEDMTSPTFWQRAMITGGGFGLFGDFLSSSENRFGQSFAGSLAGPGPAFVGDSLGLTIGNAMQAARGDDAKLGREAVQWLGRYTPVLASHWATRGAYRRLILDELQWQVDPDAHKSFKARISNARRRTGQDYWWRPGEGEPRRAPDFGAVAGP